MQKYSLWEWLTNVPEKDDSLVSVGVIYLGLNTEILIQGWILFPLKSVEVLIGYWLLDLAP